ncbi:alpha/beta fold hydrolase [Planctomycetes bacterium K23_9]|uniref:Phospholipase YtpA n=1 Tax=Stieleria marina TaxID=1930275 RepID=A0A517NPW1_9BACT|nr:Phospholipase YtpA [Planctomycetes bacterium K23_9]
MHETFFLTGRSGKLDGRVWRDEEVQAHRVLLFLHGLGDHGGRFRKLAAEFAANGWIVAAFDFPGHGRSPGKRGQVESYDGLIHDIARARIDLRKQFPHLPQVLVGHSMGGNLALNYAIRADEFDESDHPLAGLVLCAPILLPKNPPPRPQILAAWLTGIAMRWVCFNSPVPIDSLSRDKDRAAAIQSDELRHERVSLYLATQILAEGRWALDHARDCDVRTLVLYGDDDPLIDTTACRNVALRIGDNASSRGFPEMRHDLFEDIGRESVLGCLNEWLGTIERLYS